MTGFIPVYKQSGITSFMTTKKVSRIMGEKRAGHAGTLDPLATGVLPVMLGRAAKLLDYLPEDKIYRAGFKLGILTDTGDITGKVLKESEVKVKKEDISELIPEFKGQIKQLPPMYSALKHNGVPLYSFARKGIEIERVYRDITIYDIKLLSYDEESYCGEIIVHCSKGTYIRTLCEDIGNALGSGAVMNSLLRTMAYGFTLDECKSIEQLEKLISTDDIKSTVINPESALMGYKKTQVPDNGRNYYINGGFISGRRFLSPLDSEIYRVYDSSGLFLGLGKRIYDGKYGLKSVWLSEEVSQTVQ